MKNLTTAAIVICPELPVTGLSQTMHDPSIQLSFQEILEGPAISGDNTGPDITRTLICDAIKRIHAPGVMKIFEGINNAFKMPVIQHIKATTTEFWQLGGISENEGTIAGTYNVHDKIFLKQFDLDKSDPAFSNRLWLVHGDQLTAHHIRAVKAEQFRAGLPYDRRDWLLGMPAWFHVQLNLLKTIGRTHWAPKDGKRSAHCLQSDMITLGRSHGSTWENTEYHRMEPMVTQSFTARVLALFYTVLEDNGYFCNVPSSSLEQSQYITDLIGRLTPSQFCHLVDDVRERAFTLDAWNGTTCNDYDFTSMCRFLQEVELFLTLRYAIKAGDIGIMRRLVDPLIIVFFGASQSNYGHEMLFYRWHLSSVNTPELQHAILASSLVNWQGRETTHKPIDLGLEHLNGSCKIEMKCYKNSTHDTDIIFDRVCLTNTWIRKLRLRIESIFGEDMSGSHTTNPGELDMFTLARNIFEGSFARQRTISDSNAVYRYKSPNILRIGMELLEEKVDFFNQRYVVYNHQVQSINREELELDLDTTTLGIGVIDERGDWIEDPTTVLDYSQD